MRTIILIILALVASYASKAQQPNRLMKTMSETKKQEMWAVIEIQAQGIFKQQEMDVEKLHASIYAELQYNDIQYPKIYQFNDEEVTIYEFENITDLKKTLKKVVADKRFILAITKKLKDGLYFIYTYDYKFVYRN